MVGLPDRVPKAPRVALFACGLVFARSAIAAVPDECVVVEVAVPVVAVQSAPVPPIWPSNSRILDCVDVRASESSSMVSFTRSPLQAARTRQEMTVSRGTLTLTLDAMGSPVGYQPTQLREGCAALRPAFRGVLR